MKNNNKGFSLTELLVSFVIVMIVAVYLLRTVIVLMENESKLIILEEYNLYESLVLEKFKESLSEHSNYEFELDSSSSDVEKIINVKYNGSIYKTLSVVNKVNEKGIYIDDIFYEIPHNASFRRDLLVDIKPVENSENSKYISGYYIIRVPIIFNDDEYKLRFVYQNIK